MMNDEFNSKLHILLRSQRALIDMELRKKSRQLVLISIGLIALSIALVALNISIYLYLSTLLSNVFAALILSCLNIVLALLFFAVASHQKVDPNAESMEEIRDFALKQLGDDIDEVKLNVHQFTNNIKSVGHNVNSVFSRDFSLFKEVVPIIKILLDAHKKRKFEKGEDKSSQ